MKTVVACLTLAWFMFSVCTNTSLVVGQNVEHVKLDSVVLVASSPIMDIEDNLTLQTSVLVIGKC